MKSKIKLVFNKVGNNSTRPRSDRHLLKILDD